MSHSDIQGEYLSGSSNLKFRLNCEFLFSCEFHCPGCYVNRSNNYDQEQLDILSDLVSTLRVNGSTFDEIILGPTDVFGASNTIELLAEPKFNEIFKNGDVVLTILTTLQSDEKQIENVIAAINRHLTHPNQEIEVLVVVDLDKLIDRCIIYTETMKRRFGMLDTLNAKVDYATQINILDPTTVDGEFDLLAISQHVRDTFDTIVEFNPSFLRTRKPHIVDGILDAWNDMLLTQINSTNKNDITFTMANAQHAGFNEITYNFFNGELYVCPFIYENVFDRSEAFKVPRDGDRYTWNELMDHDRQVKLEQFSYVHQTDDCAACSHQMSCNAKHVHFYMKQYDMRQCMLAKDVLNYYS